MQPIQPMIEVKKLSNRYEGKLLLREVEFSLSRGEILCLLGPSGSGKTTLLRLLAGLETEFSGTISCDGQDLRGVPPHKRNFGMMFQEYALFPHKDVYSNVAFGLEMQKKDAGEQSEIVNRILTTVGLGSLGHRMVDELSGGERQRVALARSLAPKPRLLLLDEPLGSLDRELRDRLTVEIRTILKSFDVTAVFVTHDQAEAFAIADRVAILKDGCLEQVDTPEEIYRHPANETVATFLGFKNIVSGEISADAFFRNRDLEINLAGILRSQPGPGRLLIRPEGARIAVTGEEEQLTINGTVASRQFQGSCYRLSVVRGETRLVFDLPIDPVPPQEGEKVALHVNPSALVILVSTIGE
ncbi:ABC transporter ATP-binding protein [Desulfopila sp. IMCC35008]|uniref:ABC transporter ATP-binding protein n=1 Tax=Desulfopila sp. IMCC35008 TaxID=2653858 RepID=UPI0013D6C66A|nr:ABC transporter ATP-binding protein [Desulfopila sp. IMCC35008]